MEALLDVLEKLYEAHDELLQIGERKREAIVHNHLEQLNECVNKETRVLAKIAQLEQQRIEATMGYLISRGYSPNPKITVKELVRIVFKNTDKQALTNAQTKFAHLLDELSRQQSLNQKLLEQSLEYIDMSLNLYTGSEEDTVTYSHPLQGDRSQSRFSMFDKKA